MHIFWQIMKALSIDERYKALIYMSNQPSNVVTVRKKRESGFFHYLISTFFCPWIISAVSWDFWTISGLFGWAGWALSNDLLEHFMARCSFGNPCISGKWDSVFLGPNTNTKHLWIAFLRANFDFSKFWGKSCKNGRILDVGKIFIFRNFIFWPSFSYQIVKNVN